MTMGKEKKNNSNWTESEILPTDWMVNVQIFICCHNRVKMARLSIIKDRGYVIG